MHCNVTHVTTSRTVLTTAMHLFIDLNTHIAVIGKLYLSVHGHIYSQKIEAHTHSLTHTWYTLYVFVRCRPSVASPGPSIAPVARSQNLISFFSLRSTVMLVNSSAKHRLCYIFYWRE